ncbi:MAG: hypothetical protein P8Z30_02715 [Acidobacteriota bacterium]
MSEVDRHILIAEEPSIIKEVFSVIFAGLETGDNVSSAMRERLEQFSKEEYERLILDVRASKEPVGRIPPGVKSLRATQFGRVLAIACEVTSPKMLRRLKELCGPRSFPGRLASSLHDFMDTVF